MMELTGGHYRPPYRHRSRLTTVLSPRKHHAPVLLMTIVMLVLQQLPSTQGDILVYQVQSDQIIEEFRDLPATFGGNIPDTGLKMLADRAEPADGCTVMRPPPNITSKFAVVIARYNCSFEEKVRNAQQAGYAMVIVYNVGSNDLEHMSANHPQDLLIPSVFVGQNSGRGIIENYLYDRDYALVITDEIPFNINNNLLIPFAVIVGLCFLLMVLFMIVRCIRERRRSLRRRLPISVLRKIGIVKFAKGMHYEICAICLEDFVENDRLRVLPCRHAYHAPCIDPWLTKSRRVCPICKRKVFVGGERRRRSSASSSSLSSDADETRPLLTASEAVASSNNALVSAAAASVTAVTNSASESLPAVAAGPTTSSSRPSGRERETLSSASAQRRLVMTPALRDLLNQTPNLVLQAPRIDDPAAPRRAASDEDDELLDDQNVQQPPEGWIPPTGGVDNNGHGDLYAAIGGEEEPTRWQRFKRFFTPWHGEALEESSNGRNVVAGTPQIPPSDRRATPPSATSNSNNILNAHHSGSFYAHDDTTDDELLDRVQQDAAKRRQVRSAPNMASTSDGAGTSSPRVAVAALPNVNFDPSTAGGGGNWMSSSSRRQSRPRTRRRDGPGDDHIV
ncbi:E3 ubiquitin-protein ligase Godzilla isoform X2 [Anopheles cruzii]|uniref:E3 ubiquitin-protein ligase Godzilla isoform X2 n=1 Tax=Anopheles cruzii TaxID=68878 RepID=UPI0022EC9201|nr:E3 ubiquitin-protein ligase Godzilla isoform X2 [Anopheles cruzii]